VTGLLNQHLTNNSMINLLKNAANSPLERILRIQAAGTLDVGTQVLYYGQKYVVAIQGTSVTTLINVKTAEARHIDNRITCERVA
jgi:demethoxyubiquinone hydroxylase (CLK1/Coq7/Cat5 family)